MVNLHRPPAARLKEILSQKELNLRQRRWLELMKDYDIEIVYQPGSQIPGSCRRLEPEELC